MPTGRPALTGRPAAPNLGLGGQANAEPTTPTMMTLLGVFQWQISASSLFIVAAIGSCFMAWRSDQRSALRDRAETLEKELKEARDAIHSSELEIARLKALPDMTSVYHTVTAQHAENQKILARLADTQDKAMQILESIATAHPWDGTERRSTPR